MTDTLTLRLLQSHPGMQQTIDSELARLRQRLEGLQEQIEAVQNRAAQRLDVIRQHNNAAQRELAGAEKRKAQIEAECQTLAWEAHIAGIGPAAAVEAEARAATLALLAQKAEVEAEIAALTQPIEEETVSTN